MNEGGDMESVHPGIIEYVHWRLELPSRYRSFGDMPVQVGMVMEHLLYKIGKGHNDAPIRQGNSSFDEMMARQAAEVNSPFVPR